MQIISEHKLTEFAERHATSRAGILRWLQLMRQQDFNSVTELRKIFPHADLVKKETPVQLRQRVPYSSRETTFTVFNIGGNKARLITIMRYGHQQVVIHEVLTHAEYDAWNKKR
ncbi:MAG: type II toxin-antitoxin system HigB family toxin [Candidatus Poribacteria bacterium]|nr:type II toxin-antitoxin system HigB family toxin [Candidatus Poribacteria bacterium]